MGSALAGRDSGVMTWGAGGACVGTINGSIRDITGGMFVIVNLRRGIRWRLGMMVMRFGAWVAGLAGVTAEEE